MSRVSIRRRQFLLAAGGLFVPPFTARAQQAQRIWKIGFLGSAGHDVRLAALTAALRDLGYIEGKNFVFEFRWAEGKYERLPALATELAGLKVDLIVTTGTPGAMAAKKATATIPIVLATISDPVATGVVPSLARPGGNITGLMFFVAELNAKRVEFLKETLPKMKRVAALMKSDNVSMVPVLKEMMRTASALGVEVERFDVRGPQEFETAFTAMAEWRADAVVVVEDAMLNQNAGRLGAMASAKRLPSIGLIELADGGGLFAYGVNLLDMFRRAATYIDRILKGTKPAELPFERPTKFELVINMKTAKALGLTIPKTMLLRADRVIE